MDATWNFNREYEGIEISFDGKPSEEIRNKMKSAGYRWSARQMKWYAKDTLQSRKVASEIATQGEDVGEHLTFEQKMERDKERTENRQERLGLKAEKLEKKSEELIDKAHKMAGAIPFGQPILVGHHSEGRDRRYRGKIHDTFGKGFETQDEAKEVSQRLEGSQALSRKRETPGYMSRKIDKLEADLRRLEREKDGWKNQPEWEKRTNEVKEQITYWKKELEEAGGLKVTPADVKAGDEILYGGKWYEVVRVNPKTVTIKNWLNVPTFTWGAEYSNIKEVRHKAEQPQPFVSTAPDKLVSIVERSNVQTPALLYPAPQPEKKRKRVTWQGKDFTEATAKIERRKLGEGWEVGESPYEKGRFIVFRYEEPEQPASRYPDPKISTLPKDHYYFFRNKPDKYGIPSDPVMKELWVKAQVTQKGNMAFGWVAYKQELSPDALKQFDLFIDEVEAADHEKAKLFLSALSKLTLNELREQEAAVRRWSIRFPYMEKELEDEYKLYIEQRGIEQKYFEEQKREKASKPQSAQAKDLYKQMRKTNSVRELDDWRNRVLFEAHLTDVQEDILMRELAAKWREYLETRGVPASEALDKLPSDDEHFYFSTEVMIHPRTELFDDQPQKGRIRYSLNKGELFEVAIEGREGTVRLRLDDLYVTKVVEKEPIRPEQAIKIAADSIDTLRGMDVFRVLNTYKENGYQIGEYIKKNRPDLKDAVEKVFTHWGQKELLRKKYPDYDPTKHDVFWARHIKEGEAKALETYQVNRGIIEAPKDKFAEIQAQMQIDRDKIEQGYLDERAWQHTSKEYIDASLKLNRYKAKYEADPKLMAGFVTDNTRKWKEIVEKYGENGRLSDKTIEDYIKLYGEKALFSVFRGIKEKGIQGWRITPEPVIVKAIPLTPEYQEWLRIELHRSDDPIIATSKTTQLKFLVKSIDQVKKVFVVEIDAFVNRFDGIVSEMPGTQYNRGKEYPIENFDLMPLSEYLKKQGIQYKQKESVGFKNIELRVGEKEWTMQYQADKKEWHSTNNKTFKSLEEINKLLNSGEARLYIHTVRGDELFRWKPFTIPAPKFKWHDIFESEGKFYELLYAMYSTDVPEWVWHISISDAGTHHSEVELSEKALESYKPIERWKVREADIISFLKKYDTPTWDTSLYFIADSIAQYLTITLPKFPDDARRKYEQALNTLLARVKASQEDEKKPKKKIEEYKGVKYTVDKDNYVWVQESPYPKLEKHYTYFSEFKQHVDTLEKRKQDEENKPNLTTDEIYAKLFPEWNLGSIWTQSQVPEKDFIYFISTELKINEGQAAIFAPALKQKIENEWSAFKKTERDNREVQKADENRERLRNITALWNEIKDLKITGIDVKIDVNRDKPTRTYYHEYINIYMVLENGKKVKVHEEINKERPSKPNDPIYNQMFGRDTGEPLSKVIGFDKFMSYNNYEDYQAQKPKPKFAFLPEEQSEELTFGQQVEPEIKGGVKIPHKTIQVRDWTVYYEFDWKSAMKYYSGFIWVNRGIGEGVRSPIINITSSRQIQKEIDKWVEDAEKVTKKPEEKPKFVIENPFGVDLSKSVVPYPGLVKGKSLAQKEVEEILGIDIDKYDLYGNGTRIQSQKKEGDMFAEDAILISKHLTPAEMEKVKPFLKGVREIPKDVEAKSSKENLILTNTVKTIKLIVGKEEYNVSHEGQAALASVKMFFEKTGFYEQIFKKPYKAIVFGNMPEYERILKFFKENNVVVLKNPLYLTMHARTIDMQCGNEKYTISYDVGTKLFERTYLYEQLFRKPGKAIISPNMHEYEQLLKFFKENNEVVDKAVQKTIAPNPSSEDYKSGYNAAILGRVHAPVPSWSDQGKADYAAGYTEGKRILYEQPNPNSDIEGDRREYEAVLHKLPHGIRKEFEREISTLMSTQQPDRYKVALEKVKNTALKHTPIDKFAEKSKPHNLTCYKCGEKFQRIIDTAQKTIACPTCHEQIDIKKAEELERDLETGNRLTLALRKEREEPEPTPGYFTLAKAQELVKTAWDKLSDARLQEKMVLLRDYIGFIELSTDFNRETLAKGGYFAGVADAGGATGVVPVDMWLHQNLKFALSEVLKEQDRRKKEKEESPLFGQPTSLQVRDIIIHKTAKYTAVVDKVYKNGNIEITILDTNGIPEWDKSLREGFPIKMSVKYAKISEFFEKFRPESVFAPTQKKLFAGETKEEQTAQRQFKAPELKEAKVIQTREEKHRREKAKEVPKRKEFGLEAFGVQKSGMKGLSEFESPALIPQPVPKTTSQPTALAPIRVTRPILRRVTSYPTQGRIRVPPAETERIITPARRLYAMTEEQENINEEREAKELADKTIAEITMDRIKKQIAAAKQRFS